MWFGVLGPVCVATHDRPETLNGQLRAGLLALLLVHPNAPVTADSLLDALWGDADPAGAQRLQTNVAKLRRTLGEPGRLSFDAGAYRLRVEPGELDADRFDELVTEASSTSDHGRRTELLRAADGLWRGTPFQGLDLGALTAPAQRLAERRYSALEDLYAAELARGRHRPIVDELSDLAGRHPLRERLQLLALTALYRCDRRPDALAVYRRAREAVVDELGLDPGPDLQEAERRALAGLDPATGAADRPSSAPPVQVPGEPADFVGRRDELAELDALTGRSRVVVVAGGAGVGKTALAARWARANRDRFPDGLLHVDLQGFGPGDPVPATTALGGFLHALGDDAAAGQPTGPDERAARFRTLSDGRRLLVVLDNAASAEQVRPLLPAASSCLTLVTSRDRLEGLAVGEGARRLDVGRMGAADARALLAARLGDAVPDARRCDEIAERCAHLPLALRVVAERLRVPDPSGAEAVSAELDDERNRLDVLDTGDAHTSVRTVLSWSYRRLGPDAARMFRLFGFRCAHPGHLIDVPGVAALADTGDTRAVRGWLRELVRSGLVDEHPGPRYEMHDLLRLYATELAAQGDPGPAAGLRLLGQTLWAAVHAAGFVQQREVRLLTADLPAVTAPEIDGYAPALRWLDDHRPSLYCAADIASRTGLPSVAVDLSTSLWPYLDLGRHLGESRRLHTLAHAAARETGDDAAEAVVLRALGLLELRTGRCDEAVARLVDAAERQVDGSRSHSITTAYLAAAHAAAGRSGDALGLAEEVGCDDVPPLPLLTLGRCLLDAERPRDAQRYLRASVTGGGPVLVHALRSLADCCRAVGAAAEAGEHDRRADALTCPSDRRAAEPPAGAVQL